MMAMATAPPPNPTSIKPHNHPPYKEMIMSAIDSLKERKGSSKTAIAKYIQSEYKDLPPTHNALLAHHLRRLKKQGVLQMVMKSYKLSDPGKALLNAKKNLSLLDPAIAPKKRGRPPKKSTPSNNLNEGMDKKRRGRPPKILVQGGTGPPSVKRKPGRPRKHLMTAELILPRNIKSMVDGEKRRPGRPKKLGLSVGTPTTSGEKRRPGRPRKVLLPIKSKLAAALILGGKRKRGRPKKLEAFVTLGEKRKPDQLNKLATGVASGEKKRGRPKKLDAALVSSEKRKRGRPKGSLAVGSKRKPGRPKKSSSPLNLNAATMSPSGEKRKRGRPKKISAAMGNDSENLPATPLVQCTTGEAMHPLDDRSDNLLKVLFAAHASDAVENGGGILPDLTSSLAENTVAKDAVEGTESVPLLNATELGEKRKRGRPKKGSTPSTSAAVSNGGIGLPNPISASASKKRGRPPKQNIPTSLPEN